MGGTSVKTNSVSQYKSQGAYPQVAEKLSWEKIDAFPIKRVDMTEEEMRQLVVDFYIFSKSFVWVADDEYTYRLAEGYDPITLNKGELYSGFPYISKGSNNVYRMMDYMDPETGVVNIKAAGENHMLLGNQCSLSCQWAWARVIKSMKDGWTQEITKKNGYIPVGPYTYPEDLEEYTKEYSQRTVAQENGEEIMFRSYAQLKPGDGLVKYAHVIMCTGVPHIEYTADGAIDPELSYVPMSDQTRTTGWKPYTNESGDNYKMCGNINKHYRFQYLFDKGYLPFTFKEYSGEAPIEETVVTFSHAGKTITKEQLFGATVTSNYLLSDIYASVTDSKGNEVYRLAVRAKQPAVRELRFAETVIVNNSNTASVWGSWDNISADETYTVQIIAQLGTGERPTLWEGKLAK